MKTTRIIALLLALLTATTMFAACGNGGDDSSSTTTTPAATTPAPEPEGDVTTTAGDEGDEQDPDTDTDTDTDPDTDTDTDPNAEDPITTTGISALLATGSDLRDLVTDAAFSENVTPWGDGAATQAFDGNTSTTKLGGDIVAVDNKAEIDITWKTSASTTVSAYVFYTGNDSKDWPGRTPLAWEFSGSTDGENWTVIDKVTASGMADENATPYGYTVDEPAAYTSYKLHITDQTVNEKDDDGTEMIKLQLNEIVLIGTADGDAETPATSEDDLNAIKALGSDLTAHVDQESLKASASMAPWDDGAPTQAFDGDTTTTKLGGDVTGSATISWKTDVATTLKGYIFYTGNDSMDWPGRTPTAWVLYGSTDGGVTWKVIDRVTASGMADENAMPYGYTVDEPAAYTNYKLHIYGTTNTTEQPRPESPDVTTLLQLNEIILIGDAAE